MLVLPDSFFPTRQVTLGSTSIVPESRMFLNRTVLNEIRFTAALLSDAALGERVTTAFAVGWSCSGEPASKLSNLQPGAPLRSVPHRGLYRHFPTDPEGQDAYRDSVTYSAGWLLLHFFAGKALTWTDARLRRAEHVAVRVAPGWQG